MEINTEKKLNQDSAKYIHAIISSPCSKKIIIAGPGTGKSYLFSMICQEIQKKCRGKVLVMSFINELVDDLKRELYLYKKVEVKTLHSFALAQFPKNTRKIYLKTEAIIEEDYKVITGKEVKFGELLCNLIDDDSEAINFF